MASKEGFKKFVAEAKRPKNPAKREHVKITDGRYKGLTGKIVYSGLENDDEDRGMRYYVIELDTVYKGEVAVVVYNGDYDDL